MRRGALAVLVLALLALIAFFALRESTPRAAAAPVELATEKSETVEREPGSLDAPALEVRDEAPVASTTPISTPDPTPPPARKPDLAARESITFEVVNAHGYPVAGAAIELNGLRTQRSRGSHYGWRGDPQLGKTDSKGELVLAYPVWVNLDDETGEISFTVAHPDYATLENYGEPVAPRIRVVLEQGSVLVVSGWIDERSNVITDVTAQFSWDVDVGADDWLPRRDGVLTTTRVPLGTHYVYLEHESAEHALCYSALTEFTLAAGETVELHLELKPALTVRGWLDPDAPRPIEDGVAVLGVQSPASENGAGPKVLRTYETPIAADGTFTFERVMHGEAEIVALCRGWASAGGFSLSAEKDGSLERGLQRVLMGLPDLVVAVERTASLEVDVRGPDGSPLEGVTVHASPNACWSVGACGMFVDSHSWSATTDADGRARIDDIPAGSHSFTVTHPQFALPFNDPGAQHASRHRNAYFASGEVWRQTLTLERTPGD